MNAQTRRPVRLFVGILATAVLAVLAVACGDSSTSPGVVSAATVSVNPASGSANTTFTFDSVISTTAATDVTYQWERDTGELSAIQSLTFTGASSQSVAHSWQPGGCSTLSRTRWVRLIVLTPNHLVSRQAVFTVGALTSCI